MSFPPHGDPSHSSCRPSGTHPFEAVQGVVSTDDGLGLHAVSNLLPRGGMRPSAILLKQRHEILTPRISVDRVNLGDSGEHMCQISKRKSDDKVPRDPLTDSRA